MEVPNFKGTNRDSTLSINVGAKVSYDITQEFVSEPFEDSPYIIVHFLDNLSITYYRDSSSSYNPLRIENYSGGLTKKKRDRKGFNSYNYTYTFTNADFENAQTSQ
ncbi:MAG: hypothetical protein LBU90_01155 [Bacteroidales bacterium]|nr:hypothetical protein [Bacteroidales bacterium]